MSVLAGKAVVVTGAGRGLGAAYAVLAAEHGAGLVLNDVDAVAAERTAEQIRTGGGRAVTVAGDVGEWDVAEALVARCVSEFGHVDGLVNNAGVVTVCPVSAETEENLRRVIGVNLLGAAFCGTLALRVMLRQDSGSVVNVTSGAAMGVPALGAYSASKGGLTSLTYAWAAEVAGTGVRVNAVSPEARTPLAQTLAAQFPDVPAGMSDPLSNAPAVVHLLSDDARGVNGQVLLTRGVGVRLQERPRYSRLAGAEPWTVDTAAAAVGDLCPVEVS